MPGKIVFVNQATGYLTIDIINEFAGEFDEVALITGSIRAQNTPLDPKVKVSYISRYNRGNNFYKSVSWLKGTIQIFFLLRFRYGNFEKFFFTIPPTAYLMAPFFRAASSILVYDLYPDALLALGFTKKSILYRWWSEKNRVIFAKAHRVFTLGENMKSRILSYSPDANVNVIPNWSGFYDTNPIQKPENGFIKENGLSGKFVVQYSGNIGFTHNVEVLIEVAGLLKDYSDIVFVIIGRGEKAKEIRNLVSTKELTNCIMLPFKRDEDLFESLCAADLAVVTLNERTPDISVPSKTYNIMAAGVPLMVIASPDSAVGELISKHKNGRVFNRNDINDMSSFILELRDNPELCATFSAKSASAAQNYTKANAKLYLKEYKQR